jgi:uncharacterized protein (DUF58 family)
VAFNARVQIVVIEPRQILIWLAILVGLVAYGVVRPGIWPWLLIPAVLVGLINLVYRRVPKVRIERSLSSERTFQASSVHVRLELKIVCPYPTLLSLSESVPLTLIPDRTVGFNGLLWRSSRQHFEYQITPNARGGYRWPDLELSWSDPFGLFGRTVRLPNPMVATQLLVYPGLHPLELPDLMRPLLSDGPPTRIRGLEDASTFAGTRAYSVGDPMRRIHWRQTARMGMRDGRYNQLVVRELERIAATGVQVHLDQFGSGQLGSLYLESATRLAASLIHESFGLGLRVGVSSADGQSEIGAGFLALERALAHLALLRPAPEASFEIPLPMAGTNLILITMTAPNELIAAAIQARSQAAQVLVIALPEGFYIEPGETGRPIKRALPESVRELELRAGVLEEAGVRVQILRGDSSVLNLHQH